MILVTLLLKFLEFSIGFVVESDLATQIFGRIVGAGGVRFGRIFFYTQFLACVPISISLAQLLTQKTNIRSTMMQLTVLLAGISVTVIISQSKGHQLADLFSILATLLLVVVNKRRQRGIVFSLIPLVVTSLAVFMVLQPDNIIYRAFFSKDDISNSFRYEQVSYLTNDITFLGRGLGASIKGYSRAAGADYGFELSYLAAIHKFGIFALVPFFAYELTILVIIIFSRQRRLLPVEAAGLAAGMSFLLPAIGNPGLFSLPEVTSHSLVLAALALATVRKPHNVKSEDSQPSLQ